MDRQIWMEREHPCRKHQDAIRIGLLVLDLLRVN